MSRVERFQDLKDFPGYRVSTFGRVQSCWFKSWTHKRMTDDWHDLKPQGSDYLTVTLFANGVIVTIGIGRLVLETFVGPAPEGQRCAHKDDDPANNHLSNLSWQPIGRFGEKSANPKLTTAKVNRLRRKRIDGASINTLAIQFHISRSTCHGICCGKIWTKADPDLLAECAKIRGMVQPESVRDVRSLRSEGTILSEIATKTGLSMTLVKGILNGTAHADVR